jgi:hypothetical protein|tara:strand:+ start:579 stop:932 length:354 start_codon:yes stop_codon:yes gene_type:complete
MAGPALAARAIIRWALRGTKYLSPTKRTPIKTGWGFKKGKVVAKHGKVAVEHRPWMKGLAKGEKSWFGKVGIGSEGRKKFRYGYSQSYKHLKKHKKLYGAGVAGAAIWDFLPGKDNE